MKKQDNLTCSKTGFTLIELSIVLVIIGLIVGGVLVGRDLIHAAKLQKIVSEVQGFQLAINTFKMKYDGIPGDFSEAQSFWPTDCPDVGSNPCNGNGNGIIGQAFLGHDTLINEQFRAWHHLSLSGLIGYTLDGASGGLRVGENAPESVLGGGIGYSYSYMTVGAEGSVFVTGPDATVFSLGSGWNNHRFNTGALPGVDINAVDAKMDDGDVYAGRVRMKYASGTGSGCTSEFFTSSEKCIIVFRVD